MRDFTTMPVYQGARHEAGQQPGGVHSRDLTTPAIMEGAAAVQHNLEALEASFKRNEDAAQALEEDAAMRQVEERYSMAFDEKLQLANGAEGSLFNADGTRNEVEFSNFIADYRKEIEGVTRGKYWTPQVGIAAGMKRDARIEAFPLQLEAQRGRYTRQRGLKAFSDAYDLALAQENYGDAASAVEVALNAGLLSADEAKLHKLRIAKRGAQKKAAAANTARATQVPAYIEAATLAALQGDMPEEGADTESILQVPQYTLSVPAEGLQEDMGQALTLQYSPDVAKFDEAVFTGNLDSDEVFAVGVRAESDDEVVAQLEEAELAHGRLRMGASSDLGKSVPLFNSDTDESMAAHATKARKEGGTTLEWYKNAIWAAGLDLLNNPATAGMEKDNARKAWLARVTVYGLEDRLFGGNAEAMTALLDSTFEMLCSARDAEIGKRVKSLVEGGKDGLPGTGGLIDSAVQARIMARFKPSEEVVNLSRADQSWYNSDASDKRVGQGFKNLYARYKEQFLQETGYKLPTPSSSHASSSTYNPAIIGSLPSGGTPSPRSEIEDYKLQNAFKAWFFADKGVYSQMKANYVRSVTELCTQKATEAVAARRQQTGEENWAEEQKIIIQVVEREIAQLDGSPDPYSEYREDRENDLRSRAASYHDKYLRDYKPALDEAKELGAERKAEEEAKAEAVKSAAEAKKNAEKAHATRYTRTDNYTLSYKQDSTDDEAPTLYVPVEEYKEMVAQLGVKRGHGIVCTINDGDTMFAVMPAKQKGMSYNAAAFNKIYGERKRKGMTAAQLQHAVRGVPHKVTFKQF